MCRSCHVHCHHENAKSFSVEVAIAKVCSEAPSTPTLQARTEAVIKAAKDTAAAMGVSAEEQTETWMPWIKLVAESYLLMCSIACCKLYSCLSLMNYFHAHCVP